MCGFVKTDDVTGEPVPGAEDMVGYDYLYITEPALSGAAKYATGVCVKECPLESEVSSEGNCRPAGTKRACPDKFAETFRAEMFCIPRLEDNTHHASVYADLAKAIWDSEAGAIFADLSKAWGTMTLCIFTALALSIAFTWLMSRAARCLALFSIGVVLLSFVGFGIALVSIGLQHDSSGQIAAGACLLVFAAC